MIDFRFYLITDRTLHPGLELPDAVAIAVDAGVRAVQLREKDMAKAELDPLIARLHAVVSNRGARLFVNAGCRTGRLPPGVGRHFPDRTPIDTAPGAPTGASTHSVGRAVAAAEADADFVTFSPVFDTISKTSILEARGLDELARVCDAAPVPVFALGGVTPFNARACLEAGAGGVAAVGAVWGADDFADAVHRFGDAMGGL